MGRVLSPCQPGCGSPSGWRNFFGEDVACSDGARAAFSPQRRSAHVKVSAQSSSLPFPLQGTETISLSPRYHLDRDGSLLILSPSPEDAGTYFCTASNTAGFSSQEMQLSVSSECWDWPWHQLQRVTGWESMAWGLS